jgi:outer membrane protein assembly factor BamB
MPRLLFSCIALAALFLTASAHADNWPRWRGPAGDGHSAEKNLPVKWGPSDIAWKTTLKGSGQSSPIIWGDRIFLTSALESGKKRLVICVERKSGNVLWEQEAWSGTPEQTHAQNGWATATCATDGERVVAFFGKGGLHCYTVEGKHLWSRDLGSFPGPWGTAASPIIVGDLVIQNCDAAGEGLLLAVNKADGKDVWKTPRTAPERGGWTTPVLIGEEEKQELVVNGERAVTGYDPKTGKQLWSCKSFTGRGDPTVTPGRGLLFVVNGQPGDFYAIKPGGRGDVTKSHLAWHTPRKGGRDQPSPILIGEYVTVVSMSGICTGYEAATGKPLWTERIKGAYASSPVATGGLAYFQNESGETTVIRPGPKLDIVAQNSLGASGEVFRASLTPSGGQFYARSQSVLYCIGKGEKK